MLTMGKRRDIVSDELFVGLIIQPRSFSLSRRDQVSENPTASITDVYPGSTQTIRKKFTFVCLFFILYTTYIYIYIYIYTLFQY